MNHHEPTSPDIDPVEEELVAYLDEELEPEHRAQVEHRLAEDARYRDKLKHMQKSWDMLDLLARSEPDEGFTRTTVAMVALKAKEADAFFYISDAMVNSQAQLVIDMATSKKLPTMFSEQSLVAMGGLASYGQNFHEAGRLSAKYVQKIMTGAQPGDLRIETVDKFELIINLKTAKQIGLTIPPNLLARADKVIK